MKTHIYALTVPALLGLWSLPAVAQSRPSGEIGRKWEELGGDNSGLGKVTADEDDVPGLAGGRVVEFENGLICRCQQTGAHVLTGAIMEKWGAMREGRRVLGCPTTDEEDASGSGRHSDFQSGFIYWTTDTGAHAVYGEIGRKWAEMGRERSPLGHPGTDEKQEGGHRISRFQNGYIYWSDDEGIIVGPTYTFNLENLVIQKTRALHNDDDAVSFNLKVGDHVETKTTFLAGLNDGEHHIGLSIGPVFIGYNHSPISFNYVIANEGANDEWAEAVRKGGEELFKEFEGRHNAKKPSEDESPDRADVASETEYAKADGSLIAIGAAIAWEVLSDLSKGGRCNGVVAADQVTVGGRALAKWTDDTGEKRETKFHPGRNSRDLCGGNSKYLVTWSIVRN